MKRGYLAAVLLCAALGIFFLLKFLIPFAPTDDPVVPPPASSAPSASSSSVSTPPATSSVSDPPPSGSSSQSGPDPASSAASSEISEPGPAYTGPINFEEQQRTNPDLYAWIKIPGTVVDYPVFQHPTDDSFYLNHGVRRQRADAGALFTEHTYNGTDLTDPVTIIYGHRLKSGALFGGLQAFYSKTENFTKYNSITIYLPDRQIEYKIFAAVPYDNRHILYNYDFTNRRIFKSFFKSIVSIRALGANISQEDAPDPDDHVLILSTCLRGDNTQRYLVMAKQVD